MSTVPTWAELLDTFEASLHGPAGPVLPWTPAAGPLPLELTARAEALVEQMERAEQQLRQDMAILRKEIRAIDQVPQRAGADSAAYLDVSS